MTVVTIYYLNSGFEWSGRIAVELCAEAVKSGPETRRLSKNGDALKGGV